jgi:hypothetical protein
MVGIADQTPLMDPVQLPRRVTKADVPRLRDRTKAIWSGGYTNRSGWETAVYFIALVLLIVSGTLIRASHWAVGASVASGVLAFVVIVTLATAVLIKIRFRN